MPRTTSSRHRGPFHSALLPVALALVVPLTGCGLLPGRSAESVPEAEETAWSYAPDLPVTQPPYQDVHANWKQRLDQPYVFLEHVGSYVETGRLLPQVHRALEAQGLVASGPPFALFYDDPGAVSVEELRSRACVPVGARVQIAGPLAFDVLPSTTVVYALVSGPYPELPRAYAGLYQYLDHMGWGEAGPIREIYLVPPGSVDDFSALVAEVQIPAAAR